MIGSGFMAYIKKETVLEKVKKLANNLSSTCFAPPLMIREIENTPEADVVKVKHGYWTTDDDPIFGRMCVCSICGSCPTMEYKYCPYCGAKMDGKE
jgi:hypothetical protein